MSNIPQKPKPEDYKCHQLKDGNVSWNADDALIAMDYFVAKEYYERCRSELAIAALDSILKDVMINDLTTKICLKALSQIKEPEK